MAGLSGDALTSGRYFSSLRSGELFPDPFMDMASTAMPTDIRSALRWVEYLWNSHGDYRQAMERVLSYFITEIDIYDEEAGRDEKDKYKEFMEDKLGLYNQLHEICSDFIAYGNAFVSLMLPFRRYLACKGKYNGGPCGLELPLRKVANTAEFKFRWSQFDFHASCPRCGYSGPWRHIDRRGSEDGNVNVVRWSPHDIDILNDPLTGDSSYIWRIPSEYRQRVTKGELFVLERANWEVIQAIKHNNNLLFDNDVVFHMKETALAGMLNKGWGLSRLLVNFRQSWYLQVLRRYNEAIALDYVIPFRVITPAAKSGASGEAMDPALSINLGDFRSQVNMMLAKRRRDPASWHTLPFPVDYKALGGEASQMAPYQLLEIGRDDLLNASGVPAEFYRGNLSALTGGGMLRLFEASWSPLTRNMNRLVQWLITKTSQLFAWEPVKARMTRVTIADDMNRQMAKLQLMMGRQISQTSGLKSLGLGFEEEQRRLLDEDRFVAEETQKMQEEMEGTAAMVQATAGQPAPGGPPGMGAPAGAPGGGGPAGAAGAFSAASPMPPTTPTSPQDILSKADQLAQQFLAMPETQKDSELRTLKQQDEVLHSAVRSRMDSIRGRAQSAGGSMLLGQPQPQPQQKMGTARSPVPGLVTLRLLEW